MTLEDPTEQDIVENESSMLPSSCEGESKQILLHEPELLLTPIVPPTDRDSGGDAETSKDDICQDQNDVGTEYPVVEEGPMEVDSGSHGAAINHSPNNDDDPDMQRLSSEISGVCMVDDKFSDLADTKNSLEANKPSKTQACHIETWENITNRDRQLSNEDWIYVIDHSMAMLGERICEATNQNQFRESLKSFDRTLGRFLNSEIVLGRRFASGNFADIYKISAFQRHTDRNNTSDTNITPHTGEQTRAAELVTQGKPSDYVVKILRKNLLIKPSLFATAAADFITEGTLLASLHHPNILAIRGRSTTSVEGFASGKRDALFFVLERVDGTLLHKIKEWNERLLSHGLFAKARRECRFEIFQECVTAMADLASAMAYLHERRVIHRDISLGNVGISVYEGKVKLLDFGLAKVLPPATMENELFLLTGNTGSIRYMAPEIGLKQHYNLKADVYSFAILMYEVLTLEVLFTKWQSTEIFERVHHKHFRPRLHMFWSKQLKQLFRCCWSHDPTQRNQMKIVEAILKQEVKDLLMGSSDMATAN